MSEFPYPPPEPTFIKARFHGGSQKPKAIVIHGTVSSDNRGTARNIANWWAGPTSPKTSCHYVVDPGEIIQCVGDHTVGWHCGYNYGSIGIELCDEQTGPASRWRDPDSVAIVKSAARLTAELCLAYSIDAKRPTIAELKRKGPHGIYGHNDSRLAFGYSTHTDPRDFDWDGFIKQVRGEIRKIKAEVALDTSGHTARYRDRMKPDEYFIGARGRHVRWLAKRLVKHGYEGFYGSGVDLVFSEGEDRAAVRAFQRAQGWRGSDADGFPGPVTLQLLAASPPRPLPTPVDKPDPEPETETKPETKPETDTGTVEVSGQGGDEGVVPEFRLGHLVLYASQVGSIKSETPETHIEKVFALADARAVAFVVGAGGPISDEGVKILRETASRFGFDVLIPVSERAPWFALARGVVGDQVSAR